MAAAFRISMSEMFCSIKTAIIDLFDERCATLTEVADVVATVVVVAAGIGGERTFRYQDFENTKPLVFDGFWDPISAMRWLSDVEGCFFTCSCLVD